jgi:hypothetical protein
MRMNHHKLVTRKVSVVCGLKKTGTQLAEPHRLRRRSVEHLKAVGSCLQLLAKLFLLRPAACFRTTLDDLLNTYVARCPQIWQSAA